MYDGVVCVCVMLDMLLWVLSSDVIRRPADRVAAGQCRAQQDSVSARRRQPGGRRVRRRTAAEPLTTTVEETGQRSRGVEEPVPTNRHHLGTRYRYRTIASRQTVQPPRE